MSENPPAATKVTRAVSPEDLLTLLEHPPRATLAFVQDGAIHAMPVAFRFTDARYLVALPTAFEPPTGRVKLLIDDGTWYFDLRGVWARGTLKTCQPPTSASQAQAWFELSPEKVAAWHYGTLRVRS